MLSAACAPVARLQSLSHVSGTALNASEHVCVVARREAAVRALDLRCHASTIGDGPLWNLLLWAPRDATPEILRFSFGLWYVRRSVRSIFLLFPFLSFQYAHIETDAPFMV